MKPHRGFLSERFVDTLGGVREALCCRSLKHERTALCATVATEQLFSNFLIAIMHLKAFAKVVECLKQEMSWKETDGLGKNNVNFSFRFLLWDLLFNDGLLHKTGQTSRSHLMSRF